jgi:hypothetical protein
MYLLLNRLKLIPNDVLALRITACRAYKHCKAQKLITSGSATNVKKVKFSKFTFLHLNNFIHEPRARVKWVPCQHGTVRPEVAVGENGLQIWRVPANILSKQSRTTDRGGPLAWG